MTNVGVFNPNWRDGEVRRYVTELGKSTPKLCKCGNSTSGIPLYLVGKTDLCFTCYEADKAAKELYGSDWENDADRLRELLEPHAVDFSYVIDEHVQADELEPVNNAELRQSMDWEFTPIPKDMPIIDMDNVKEIPF